MNKQKLKTVLLWVLYVVVCLASAAIPLLERLIRKNLIGKEVEEQDERYDSFYHRSDYNHYGF